ncbi:cation transporter [Litorisediminicola beolgyonensis]|uniref:Cation transporter n=1 Tax=Litorisediminicola beolgyonensis TaxID=1173614 RepID=A0ABW3ZE59_9RHOB
MQHLSFAIENMTCGGCAARATRALEEVPGVSEAQVNLVTKRGSVTGEDLSPSALIEALDAAGYPARQEEIALDVTGLNCGGCVGRVERALLAEPGVLSANVNLATGRVTVTVLAGARDAGALARASTEAGYPATPHDKAAPQQTDDTKEIDTLRRDLVVAAALTLPVFLVEMGGHLIPGLGGWIDATIGRQTSWLTQMVLIGAVLAGPGLRFYITGFKALRHGAPDMNSLVMVGTGAAYGFSLIATLLPGLLPEGTRHVYYESAGVIVTLILFGRWLEARAKRRTGAAIRALAGLAPPQRAGRAERRSDRDRPRRDRARRYPASCARRARTGRCRGDRGAVASR